MKVAKGEHNEEVESIFLVVMEELANIWILDFGCSNYVSS